jgi:hypothetical protein
MPQGYVVHNIPLGYSFSTYLKVRVCTYIPQGYCLHVHTSMLFCARTHLKVTVCTYIPECYCVHVRASRLLLHVHISRLLLHVDASRLLRARTHCQFILKVGVNDVNAAVFVVR